MGHNELDLGWLCGEWENDDFIYLLFLGFLICLHWFKQATVSIHNFQQYRHIQAPGWQLGWTWAKKEVIWSMLGGQTMEQGDCSRFPGSIPHCCKRDPAVVDLLPGTPDNLQTANCCRGGVLSSRVQDPPNAVSAFQITVGLAGTTNKTVRSPKNFTLNAPGPGYTCGYPKPVRPTRFVTPDKRRFTQAMSKPILILNEAHCVILKLSDI